MIKESMEKMGNKKWERNILGKKVVIVSWTPRDGDIIFNAYVIIPNSRHLRLEILGNDATYRDGDEVGVDSAHRWLEGRSSYRKIRYCLNAVKRVIENCRVVLI